MEGALIGIVSFVSSHLHSDVSKPTTTGRTGLTGFLEDKTGVTGAWTLGVGVAAYLLSKEIYILNNEVGVAVQSDGWR